MQKERPGSRGDSLMVSRLVNLTTPLKRGLCANLVSCLLNTKDIYEAPWKTCTRALEHEHQTLDRKRFIGQKMCIKMWYADFLAWSSGITPDTPKKPLVTCTMLPTIPEVKVQTEMRLKEESKSQSQSKHPRSQNYHNYSIHCHTEIYSLNKSTHQGRS